MFFYEGYHCPVCQQSFQANEDVVACPECGLPHHRTCWIKEGHCHLQYLHHTPEQWTRDRVPANAQPSIDDAAAHRIQQVCPRCQTKNPEFAEICTHCGMLLQPEQSFGTAPKATYHEYRPYGTQPHPAYEASHPQEQIDGVKVNDLTAIVSVKTEYYLPRFRRMSRTSRASWNWASFLLTPYWLLYRKMYVYGILFIALQSLETLMMYLVYGALGISAEMDMEAMMRTVESAMSSRPAMLYCLLAISLFSGILFLIKVLIGVFGNRLYQRHCGQVIRRTKQHTPDITAGELATIGGTSAAMSIIGYFVSYFITQVMILLLL